MPPIVFTVLVYLVLLSCNSTSIRPEMAEKTADNRAPDKKLVIIDSMPALNDPGRAKKEYEYLEYDTVELLVSAPGTKSVIFSKDGSRLYAMNLEGMSIHEFNRSTRKLTRQLRFGRTRSAGWDYEKHESIPSWEEKPVEACLSHNDKILWVSLHNAGGIVPVRVDSLEANTPIRRSGSDKSITVDYPGSDRKDSFYVPIIRTGKTPKIISRTSDSRYLLVSNWHSNTVSVLETDAGTYPYARTVATIPVQAIPRGIAVDDKYNRSFVAIMGGSSIEVINNSVWMKEKIMHVSANPRHIVTDTASRIFVSYNNLSKIACIDANTGKSLFSTTTAAQPRTIMLSKNQQFLFVTCYGSDTLDVFKINPRNFQKIVSLPCRGKPVGVDIYESNDTLEAWVCSYTSGSISIFSFNKK